MTPELRTAAGLRERHEALTREQPGLRARDAAAQLGVSEAELVAARIGHGVTRLGSDCASLLQALPAIGPVMALTRNAHCVHEKHGSFGNVSIGPGHGLVLNHDIDLRLFMSHWRYAFAVREEVASGLRDSLQFFDIDGTAVHKVYATAATDRAGFAALVSRSTADAQSPALTIAPLPPRRHDRPDHEIDLPNFRAHWRALQDTHDFFGLLMEFGVGRLQAMRLAGEEFAAPLEPAAMQLALESVAASGVPIMCFVGNPGCIQIHTGAINATKVLGPWFNVLDPGFNLHARQDRIASAWAVRKPTRDGIVTSIEVFDAGGECFVQFFGERKPGRAELPEWRAVVAGLPAAPHLASVA